MKLKTLVILVALAVILCGLAYYTNREKNKVCAPAALGRKVLPNLQINSIGKIAVTSQEGTTILVRENGKWIVASRFNYPANFDKIADTMRELSELKIGQTVNLSSSEIASFNLLDPRTGTNKVSGSGTLVELRDAKNGLLASLVVGKDFMRQPASSPQESMMMGGFGGYADGQYIKTTDNKVYLVSKTLGRLTEDAKTWLENTLINVPSDDLKEITVTGPDRAAIKLTRPEDGGSFELADVKAEEGTPENSKISQMANALSQFSFDDVAAPDITARETGLDRPIVFTATAKDGLIYKLRIGNSLTNDTFNRYFTISVTNNPAIVREASQTNKEAKAESADKKEELKKNPAEEAAAMNSRFGSWTYVIKSYRAEPLLYQRGDLIKKPEPPKSEETQTDTPSAKSDEKTKKSSKNKSKK